MAFHWDEGFHLLAARFISAGKRPYLDFLYAQAPLNAYWNALWFRLLHPSWQLAHVVAAFETWCAVLLTARHVWRRFPVVEFRRPAGLVVVTLFGLLSLTFDFGTIAQAYAFCLLMVTAVFSMTLAAREQRGLWRAALAGALAGAAAAASLLIVAVIPALLAWLWFYDLNGRRWQKSAAFAVGAVLPAIPVLWLVAEGPRQVWFGLVQYHAVYRRADWPGATMHDIDILSQWIHDTQQLILFGLAVAGWLVIRKSLWAMERRAEFHLCALLVLAIAAQNVLAHPTFPQYFIFAVPFLAVLACAGLYALLCRLNLADRGWQMATVLACFMLLALGRSIFQGRDSESWKNLAKIAAKVDEVAPRGAPVVVQEPIYILTGRQVPYGMEFEFAHKLDLGADRNRLFHILPRAELDRELKAGRFAANAICDDDDQIDRVNKLGAFAKRWDSDNCTVFWQPNSK
jgi:hypothetical protein